MDIVNEISDRIRITYTAVDPADPWVSDRVRVAATISIEMDDYKSIPYELRVSGTVRALTRTYTACTYAAAYRDACVAAETQVARLTAAVRERAEAYAAALIDSPFHLPTPGGQS